MTRLPIILVALALSACGAIAPDRNNTLPNHPGGSVSLALSTIAAHDGPVILSNHYVSAGTYWLGHPEACVVEGASFTFHQPSVLGLFPVSQRTMDKAHEPILDLYKGELRDWYVKHYARASPLGVYWFRGLTASQIVEMGAAVFCDEVEP